MRRYLLFDSERHIICYKKKYYDIYDIHKLSKDIISEQISEIVDFNGTKNAGIDLLKNKKE